MSGFWLWLLASFAFFLLVLAAYSFVRHTAVQKEKAGELTRYQVIMIVCAAVIASFWAFFRFDPLARQSRANEAALRNAKAALRKAKNAPRKKAFR